ncbi:hypothetical protein [Nocardia sp. NBC_01327]|uniref:hypothetical protein n=1 Tax=Nocardia sp. NBC_01327 TaxID=2903593 RepID=UPI002E15747D|nr:hypothetical protein OG326_15020 [Nocardia sp. NBC_01327]
MDMKHIVPLVFRACRGVGSTIAGAVAVVYAAPSASAQITNPLGGIKPDFGLFDGALDSSWKRIVAFLWAMVVIGASVRVIIGAFKVKRAKSRGYANDLAEGSEELQDALVSLGLVGLASPLVATVLFVVGG